MPKSEHREQVVSWILHSLKGVLGYEDIRKEIILSLFPSVQNPDHIKTFDAHISYTSKASYTKHYQKKVDGILKYCKSAMDLDDYTVFTATNLEEYRTKAQGRDTETHYQMFVIDNTHKTLFVIDPALKPNKKPGIYVPQVALEIVMPFFKEHDYKTTFVPLSHPAQTDDSEDNADVFCQSWTLYILLELLKQGQKTKKADHTFSGITIDIPKDQSKRYQLLLKFYKNILRTIPIVGTVLNQEYVSELKLYKPDGYQDILGLNAHDVALTLQSSEMSK